MKSQLDYIRALESSSDIHHREAKRLGFNLKSTDRYYTLVGGILRRLPSHEVPPDNVLEFDQYIGLDIDVEASRSQRGIKSQPSLADLRVSCGSARALHVMKPGREYI